MDNENMMLTVAIVAVALSIVGFTTTYSSVSSFNDLMTGFATEEGFVNLSIATNALINITSAAGDDTNQTINWGDGFVTNGFDEAVLATNGSGECTNCDGGWTTKSPGFTIENIGNVPVQINVSADNTAATFPAGAGAEFQWNMTENVSNSCTTWHSAWTGDFDDFTTDPNNGPSCGVFNSTGPTDKLRLDVRIVVPSASPPGTKSTEIVLSYV